ENSRRLSRPRLCQQCHIESRHPTTPYGRDTGSLKFVMGRSCSSCHVNIHGSTHPWGHAFTREERIMMSAIGRVGLIFVALLAPLAAAPAGAQTQFGGWTLEGAIGAGPPPPPRQSAHTQH